MRRQLHSRRGDKLVVQGQGLARSSEDLERIVVRRTTEHRCISETWRRFVMGMPSG